ncbi:hypothetical protein MSG28_005896 [Choristoneura fumiferana]|uniref:Uncharacterized protein n=1 Tax=Choristoneura fumiferana TaxID=7141 RepID=A0ACC0L166_CHOFU|nr:hypothetical protein MSG28_005896 [Choristoneura fumiferana]
MAPTPQELALQEHVLPSDGGGVDSASLNGQRVVISGMSGLYPSSHHIKELCDALYNRVDLLSEANPRWTYDNPEVPQYVGVVPELDKFDAQFFKVHYHLCCSMDTMGRKVLEQSYQAIYDAGVNPEQLSGKKIGVFIGSCLSETEKATFYVATSRNGFGIAGCNKSMFANRISYWLNAKGPSQAIDAACCSSTVALEQAYLAMSRGDCEAAIVGGANVCLHPQTSFHYGRTINLCKDGATRSYDQGANGCVRSEAINVLFLQKACDALRIYADVVHVKNSFVSLRKTDTGQKYGFGRDLDVMTSFLHSFYDEAKISPEEVEYVEGAGTADQESDKVELEAFDKVFCQNRTEPLKVGSVMSNVGYCEAAAGITAVTKVLLGYHKGELAGNLHCSNPREDVEGLREGRIEILSDNKPIKRTYIAVNGLSITGINSHVLLDGHYKQKDLNKYQCNLPRLVMLTGRQDSAVQKVINDLKSRTIDPEELALLQNIHTAKISGHLGRGYVILETDKENKTVSLSEKADYFDGGDRPLWFVYSGMGSQWAGMGAQLMRIPIFSAAIERFSHSVGELGCAYADGCLTAEEMILSAYSRGLVSIQTPFIRGSMAAVGIGFEEVSKMCPPEIEVACHNGPDSSTISGPAEIMTEFVAQLTAKGIFAKEVPCSNIAYHSRYIAEAGPGLLKYLSDVIKTPKLRSEKWVSTSVPQDKWNEESAQYSSAEYHTNNLLSPVLFEETSRLVPATAVLVEVAPHGLLQAILKRSLPPSCAHVPLTRRAHPDNARFLLEAIGKIYMEGYYPDVRVLYPKVEFPVSTGTPHLSQLVEWAHNETWLLPLYAGAQRKMAATCTFVMSIHDLEYKYLQGNRINGSTVYPFAGALVLAWDTLAMTLGATRKQLSVQFRDVQLFAQPALHDSRQLRLAVTLQRGTGLFEVLDNGSRVATGYISAEKVTPSDSKETTANTAASNVTPLTTEDVYKIFSDKSYMYRDEFQSIKDTNADFTEGHLLWKNNWVTFIDGILQFNTLRQVHNGISQPVYIRKLTINADDMAKNTETETEHPKVLKINICPLQDYTRCEGILLESLRFQDIPNTDENELGLKVLKFVPRFSDRNDSNVKQILQVFAQIVDENIDKNFINIVEIYDDNGDTSIFGDFKINIDESSQIIGKYDKVHRDNVSSDAVTEADLVLISNLSTDDSMCQSLYKTLKQNTFIITAEEQNVNLSRVRPKALFNIVSGHNTEIKRFELIQWRPNPIRGTSAFSVRTSLDLKLLHTARANLPSRHKMIIFASYTMVSELKDLIKQWRQDSERNQVHLLTFKDQISENLTLDQLPHLDLAFNIVYHYNLALAKLKCDKVKVRYSHLHEYVNQQDVVRRHF